ncbi:hypothetical protein ACPW7Z_08130 [Bifidobacterium adolescentis]|uniref:hypothetical protein n=1 Tax=Bifidobacterium adolescentis TaxID=1680 RepID=UPI00117890A7|nr:hypothetical protein [Bifidobacterium adolescentis]
MAFFQPFQAVLNPKSPVFVTTKAGEPLIAQRLTRPNKPRCLSAGPLRPPSAYRIRGSAARAPVRLRHGDVTRGTHHGFAIEGEAIAHDVFVGVGIVFGSIILVVIVAVLSRRGILVGVILTVLVGIVRIFSSVAIVVSIVRIAGFAVIGCRARIAIRHSIRAIFAGADCPATSCPAMSATSDPTAFSASDCCVDSGWLAADSTATLPPSVTVSSANAVAPAPVVPASIAIVTSNAVNFPIRAPHRLMKPASGSFIHFMTCPSLMALRRIAYAPPCLEPYG